MWDKVFVSIDSVYLNIFNNEQWARNNLCSLINLFFGKHSHPDMDPGVIEKAFRVEKPEYIYEKKKIKLRVTKGPRQGFDLYTKGWKGQRIGGTDRFHGGIIASMGGLSCYKDRDEGYFKAMNQTFKMLDYMFGSHQYNELKISQLEIALDIPVAKKDVLIECSSMVKNHKNTDYFKIQKGNSRYKVSVYPKDVKDKFLPEMTRIEFVIPTSVINYVLKGQYLYPTDLKKSSNKILDEFSEKICDLINKDMKVSVVSHGEIKTLRKISIADVKNALLNLGNLFWNFKAFKRSVNKTHNSYRQNYVKSYKNLKVLESRLRTVCKGKIKANSHSLHKKINTTRTTAEKFLNKIKRHPDMFPGFSIELGLIQYSPPVLQERM